MTHQQSHRPQPHGHQHHRPHPHDQYRSRGERDDRPNRSLDRIIVVLFVVAGLLAAVIAATFLAQFRLPDAAADSGATGLLGPGFADLPGFVRAPGGTDDRATPPPAPAPAVELEELPAGCTERSGCDLGNGEIGLRTSTGAVVGVTDDGAAQLVGNLMIPTTGGDVELVNADVDVEVDDAGNIVSVEGTADVPLPATGIFSAAAIVDGARAEVGYDWGYNLGHLGAYVNPNRQYYYFTFEDSFSMRTGFDQLFGDIDGLPVSLSVPGDTSVTVVLDPLDPFFYIGGACPDFGGSGDGADSGSNSQSNLSGQNRSENGGGTSEAANLRVGGDGGEDCGLGASLGGFIPFAAQSPTGAGPGLASFNGHLVVHHHAIPVQQGVFVDGELVVRVGDDGLAFGANGDIYATVPLVADVLDFGFPLGQASAGYSIGGADSTVDLFVSGSFGGGVGTALPAWLPITPPPGNTATASARLVFDPSSPSLLGPESHLEISGEMNLGAGFLADLTGATSQPLQTSRATLRIDATGARLQGTSSAQLLPNVRFGGEMSVDAYIAPGNPGASYVELVGSAGIGDVLLDGDARFRLDANGVAASGHITTPVSQVAVEGVISSAEVTLRGRASVSVGTGEIFGLLDGVGEAAVDARAAIDRLEPQIAATRDEVIAEREQALSALRQELFDAEGVLVRVGEDVSDLQRNIDEFEDELDEIADEIAKFLIGLLPRGLREDAERLRADLDAAEDDLDDLLDERTRASRAVEAAERALAEFEDEIARIAVDLDPRVARLIAEREGLELLAAGAEGLAAVLNLDARVQAEIDLVFSTSGVSGAVTGQVCSGSGCLDLIGGSVSFMPTPEACFTVAGASGCVGF